MRAAQRSATKRKGNTKDSPQVRLKYKPQGKTLAEFHERTEFVRIIIGPIGSGKTFAAISEILRSMHRQVPDANGVRRSRWCVARNSLPDLLSTTIPDVQLIVDPMDIGVWNFSSPITWSTKYRRQDGTVVEGVILFRSFDGEQDVKKARGMQLTGIWVDELPEFHKSNFDMLIGRVKRFPPRAQVPNAEFECLATGNACPRDHWLGELVFAPKPPDNWWIGVQPGGVVEQGNSWIENPKAENIANLPPRYYLDQLGGKKDSWIRQNLANEFVHHVDGRPVHPDFNERIHVAPVEAVHGIGLYVGIDFGRTPAAVIGQPQPDGRWFFLRELVTVNMGAEMFGRLLRDMLNEHYPGFDIIEFTGDPSGDSMAQTRDETPFDMLETAGIYASPAYTNDPLIRFAALDGLLRELIGGQPALLIDPKCKTLIRGLSGEYCFRRLQVVGAERYQDKPDKGPTSHVCEASHYLLLGAGEGDALFDTGSNQEYDELASYAIPDHVYE